MHGTSNAMKSQQQMAQRLYTYTEDQITQRMCIDYYPAYWKQMPKKYKRHYNSSSSRPDILLWRKENGLRNSGGVSRTAN
jgi:hypothetical protein